MSTSGERHEWQEPGHRWFDVNNATALIAFNLVVAAVVIQALVRRKIAQTWGL